MLSHSSGSNGPNVSFRHYELSKDDRGTLRHCGKRSRQEIPVSPGRRTAGCLRLSDRRGDGDIVSGPPSAVPSGVASTVSAPRAAST